jgi:hypothetical protein
MFNYNKMIQRAIEFFPRWSDIRKRYNTSNGGNLVSAVLDESLKLEEAIQDYINSYFLESYEGHEDEVMAFSYIARIGKVENLNTLRVEYNNIMLMITTDVKVFEHDLYDNYVYYEEGTLHIKESMYIEGQPLVVIIEDSESEYELIKYHIWNIFDEFATFVNTRRYENETNKQLLDRILYITRNLPNGSESGLKHAIISELMHFDPNITEDDIKIERATPQNLIKPYEDFESLLDKLMYINRDVYKCKRWDLDYWQYDFESISYMPHKWNETLTTWQNGIGHKDDLEVVISDASDVTDAKLTLYDKSLIEFEKYVQNKDIPCDIDFKLTKYNNILNKAKVRYKIKASEAVDITNENINLYLYESNKVTERVNVENLYAHGYDIKRVDMSVLPNTDLNWYKLKFDYDKADFKISNAKVRYTNESTGRVEYVQDLIKKQNGFIVNAEGELVYAASGKQLNRIEDFNSSEFLMNTDEGITIANNETTGSATISIDKYMGMNMQVNSSCEEVDIPKTIVKSKGTYWTDQNELVIRGDYSIEDKVVTIETIANTFSFDVISSKLTGVTTVTLYDPLHDEPVTTTLSSYRDENGQSHFEIEKTDAPRMIKIVIETLSFKDVVLGNFKYSNYVISISTAKGKLVTVDKDKYILPSVPGNELIVTLITGTGKKPVIHGIEVGSSLQRPTYVTDYIEAKSFNGGAMCSRKFDINTNAKITLLKYIPLTDDSIKTVILDFDNDLYVLIKDIFKDNLLPFVVLNCTDQVNNSPDRNAAYDSIIENLVVTLKDDILSYLNLNDCLAKYKQRFLGEDNILSLLIDDMVNGIDSFIEAMKDEPVYTDEGLRSTYTLSDIFQDLNKDFDQLTLLDKLEWNSLANNSANKLLTNMTKESTKDMGEFNPRTVFTGLGEMSYIRLDLSEYESVEDIIPDGGTKDVIIENGVKYYNIKLNNRVSVSSVEVIGVKNKELRVIPLIDMIKYHIPDFNITNDSIYCSRLMDAVIVSRKNPRGTPYQALIKLGSDMLTGLTVSKYQLELPEHIGSRYGTHTTSSNESPIHYNSFDYISFYPAEGQIYEAINEYGSYLEYNRNIKILNNFSPDLNTESLLAYKIELFNKSDNDKFVVKFHNDINEKQNIYNLDDWCLGEHHIAIHNSIDLYNDINYSVSTYDINSNELLSSMIDIKDTYIINNSMILDTTQFIVEPPEGLTVKYEIYNGSESKGHLLKTEEIIIDSNGFTKLTYSNVDGIYHLSKKMPEDTYTKEDIDYELLGEQGIIVWSNNVEAGTKYYIVYSIKKPVGFLFDIEDLYKAIDYDLEAYKRIDTIEIKDLKDEDVYNYSDIDKIKDVDLIHIECSNPTFEGIVMNDKQYIRFNKFIEQPTLLIKSGYYYINGKEYYLYTEDKDEQLVNNQYYNYENVDISGGEILTYKPTNNYVFNTEMRLKGKASIFNYDCQQDLKYGISTLNSLTACNSYNDWTYFATTPELVKGVNGLAMRFNPNLDCSYSYLDITNALVAGETNYISLIASDGLKLSIGREEPFLDIKFTRTLNMRLIKDMPYEGSEIRMITLSKELDDKYYLVVQGSGILDDIIITTNKEDALNGHNKNINMLGLDLLETKVQGTEFRLSIDDNKDYSPYEAAMMSNGYIKTTSKIDWYVTEIASFNKEEDFYNCILNSVDVSRSYISTSNIGGYIITPPIYINNNSTVKKLIVKINDVEIEQMYGFNTIAYTSNTSDENYIPIGSSKDNKFYLLDKSLLNYVKFKIEMPPNKVINNIEVFIEYISSEENYLRLPLQESGYIISKIYDLQEISNYRLKDLNIADISNINDVEIYIRASRDIEKLEVWHKWERIKIKDDLTLKEYMMFFDVRFMQLKIQLKTRKSYIKFNHLDIEVI